MAIPLTVGLIPKRLFTPALPNTVKLLCGFDITPTVA